MRGQWSNTAACSYPPSPPSPFSCLNGLVVSTPENVGVSPILVLVLANTCCIPHLMFLSPHKLVTIPCPGTSTVDVAGAMLNTTCHEAFVAPAAKRARSTLQRRTCNTNNPPWRRARRRSANFVPGRVISMVALVRRCQTFRCARPADGYPRRGGSGRLKSWKGFWRACSRLCWVAGT